MPAQTLWMSHLIYCQVHWTSGNRPLAGASARPSESRLSSHHRVLARSRIARGLQEADSFHRKHRQDRSSLMAPERFNAAEARFDFA
jgi:hypothetical protein